MNSEDLLCLYLKLLCLRLRILCKIPTLQPMSGADPVINTSHESNRQCSPSVSSSSNDNNTGDRTKMRTTGFTKAGPVSMCCYSSLTYMLLVFLHSN